MNSSDPTIQYLLDAVKELKEANEVLLKKVLVQEENNEYHCENHESLEEKVHEDYKFLSRRLEKEAHMTKQEICEYVEEVIENIHPLMDDCQAAYSEKEGCMGYYHQGNHSFISWDRSEVMKEHTITIS